MNFGELDTRPTVIAAPSPKNPKFTLGNTGPKIIDTRPTIIEPVNRMEPNKDSPKAATHRDKDNPPARQSMSGIIGSLGGITR
jgi:hypothetical protein